MIISDAFKNDTLGKNTQIIPLVIIEKLFYVYSDWAKVAQKGKNFRRDIGRFFGF